MTTTDLAVRLPALTDPPTVDVVAHPRPDDGPAPGWERLELLVAELQPLDGQIARGRLPGVVAGLRPGSSAVARSVRTGARVAVLGGSAGLGTARPGCFATWFDAPASALVPLPAAVADDVVAAGLSSAIAAALALDDHAGVRPGERVLVLGASGGVGRAAVELAAAAGGEVVALARDPAALAELPAEVGPLDLLDDPSAFPGGRVDVIVDPLGGAWTPAAARLGASRCRHVLLGYAAGVTASLLVPALLVNEHRLMALNVHATPEERLREVAVRCIDALAAGTLRPRVGTRYALAEAPAAFVGEPQGARPLLVPGDHGRSGDRER